MSGLTIGWEYLTGRCVATDPVSRQRAEWPPHPARVFMALAAAWFETGEDPSEGEALRWLEKLGEPRIAIPADVGLGQRELVTVFVPVNDTGGPSAAALQSAPTITRDKYPRTFPSQWVGDAACFMHWPNATAADVDAYRRALDRVCGKVTRIGHSSSLVRMWLADGPGLPDGSETLVPDDDLSDMHARRVSEGTLDLLDRLFNRRGREEHARLRSNVEELAVQKKSIHGKGTSERKAAVDRQIETLRENLGSIDPRPPIRPKLGLWSGYRRRESQSSSDAPRSDFDSDLLILAQVDGPRLPAASTLAVTQALRGAVMKHSEIQPPPSWISGHHENRRPLREGGQHLAYVPLPFVGAETADGHLLGAALVFPRAVPRPDRALAVRRLLLEPSGNVSPVTLVLGSLGVWSLIKRDWTELRQTLKPEAWTANPRGATTWASVTPVVLDRFPKADRIRERAAWEIEVAGIIVTACQRLGLPRPVMVDVGTTSWHNGSPRAYAQRRPLRGQPAAAQKSTSLGDGFPVYPAKGSSGPRPQLHVCVRFAEPVVGPILVCAGRFLGYGLCKPLWAGASR